SSQETFDEMKKSGAQGVIAVAGALTFLRRQQIADLALSLRLPSCSPFFESVAAGGLASLGPGLIVMTCEAAGSVSTIIHGANPADLPVQQPTRYSLYINLRTAKALGITIPPALLGRADEVIE